MNTDTEPSAQPDGQAVELVYLLTRADIVRALRTRDAHTASGRRARWVFPLGGLMGVGFGALALAEGEGVLGRPLFFLVAGAFLWALVLFGPQLQARAFGGLLEKAGEARVVVDASGVHVTTSDTRTHIGWAAQPRYTETDGMFLLLSDDKRAAAMTMLPKRGAQDPADIDRLRAVLDRNLRRI
ncbi:YcxB family protein [Streptomyces sp. NPDC002602]|uniref:YcxB family protein n=1 Tax=Streptomyces sp. NPDC002602 TaxID=3364654 RepID=UPI0036C6E0BA